MKRRRSRVVLNDSGFRVLGRPLHSCFFGVSTPTSLSMRPRDAFRVPHKPRVLPTRRGCHPRPFRSVYSLGPVFSVCPEPSYPCRLIVKTSSVFGLGRTAQPCRSPPVPPHPVPPEGTEELLKSQQGFRSLLWTSYRTNYHGAKGPEGVRV